MGVARENGRRTKGMAGPDGQEATVNNGAMRGVRSIRELFLGVNGDQHELCA
jgi:hypothetical protein